MRGMRREFGTSRADERRARALTRQTRVGSSQRVAGSSRLGFHHEALLYADEEQFLAGTLPFIREGLAHDEAILAVLGAERGARLRAALGGDAARVAFKDMDFVGANPARIIPEWQEFVAHGRGRPLRGIAEPISAGRTADRLVEYHRHEALLNVAFGQTPGFALLCPYDTVSLDASVIAEARRTHPLIGAAGHTGASDDFAGPDAAAAPFAEPLPEPDAPTTALPFDGRHLSALRARVAHAAAGAGMTPARVPDLILAVSEVAANSVRHGGGRGLLRMWRQSASLVCEISDRGRLKDPLAGRRRPVLGQIGGYGLWVANQVCELVQVRTLPTGTVVRLHIGLS